MRGFFERSSLQSDAFSGSASANAMAVLESSCVSDKFKLCKDELRVRAFFNAKIYTHINGKVLVLDVKRQGEIRHTYTLIGIMSQWVH